MIGKLAQEFLEHKLNDDEDYVKPAMQTHVGNKQTVYAGASNGSLADNDILISGYQAAKAFQEVYAMFKRFEVEELRGYGSIDDSITLKFLLGTNGVVRIKGRCSSKHGLLRYRMGRGVANWKVDCKCGTKDDDGERMLACDACGVWHHTRCAGIKNSDALPSKFHCFRCIDLYSKSPRQSDNERGSSKVTKAGFVCRGESTAMGSGSNLSVTLSVG